MRRYQASQCCPLLASPIWSASTLGRTALHRRDRTPVGDAPITALTDTWFVRPKFANYSSPILPPSRGGQPVAAPDVFDPPRRALNFRPRRAGKGIDFEFAAQLSRGRSMLDAGSPALGIAPTHAGSRLPDDLLWLCNVGLGLSTRFS